MQKVQRKDKAEKEDVGWWTEIRNGEEQNLLGKNKYFRGKGQQLKKIQKKLAMKQKVHMSAEIIQLLLYC